jgi:hypothetical protein
MVVFIVMKGMISMISHSKELIDLIDIRIKAFLSNFIYITDKEGKITQLQDSNGKYGITINGVEYRVPKKDNDNTSYQLNDIVLIKLYNGNFNRKYIECKLPNW